jgi:hypothetical protein
MKIFIARTVQVLFVLLILVNTLWAFEDQAPPADWDYPNHTVDGDVVRGEFEDYEIIKEFGGHPT